GDVTGDGVPNVVVDDYGDQLFVINGETGATEYTINVSGTDQLNQNNSANAIGDVDGDGYGEIFVLKKNLQWSRFDFDGSTWTETTSGSTAAELADVFRYTPQLADFNGDGNVELFSGSQIWNADFSGAVDIIADGGVNVGDLGGSVAIDILPDAFCADCAGLELVVGGSVFSVNIGTGTITEQVAANGLSATAKLSFGTGVADVDGDGDFDVAYMQEDGVNTIFYVWDGQTNTILLQYTLPNSGTKHGRVNIADFDGDGFLEFGLHYEDDTNTDLAYYAVIEDLITTSTGTLVWRVETNDGSGKTGTTVYDFDGDGAAEVVYRDETDLRIFRGKDGFVLFLTPCSSITRYELPITADVNGDGLANLLCTCDDIGLTLFESASDPWVPARAVWNQHSYNITNVNDDLTIPTSPNNNLSVAGGRFNNHLVQSPPVLISGEPEVNSDPDATITAVAINTKSGCPGGIDIDVTIGNLGDKDLSSSTLLSVYDADPELIAANLLHSQTIGRMVAVSGSQTITVTVPSCFSGTYHFVVNDPGTGTLPYSFTTDFPISGVSECDYTNNDNQLSVTLPIELTTFDARPVDQDVLLTWRTETELQNDYFTVEHSLDNRNWKTIAVVEGAGNSSLPINYEAYDRQPFKGLNYYRLKQTDFDGAFTYSEIRSVRFNTLEAGEWTLYPNPAKATLTLESQGLETGPIQLFNAFGAKQQVVLLNRQETSTGGVQINLSVDHLPPGVYHLSIGNASYRFVKL
ncbi:MAG: FG-GAP-like repeat-containing protein, partial [Bacteroidota bacterium]